MSGRLRVRVDSTGQRCCRTADGYVLFACHWRHARVAIVRPGGLAPFVYLRSMNEAVTAIEADRSAKAGR